MSTIVLTQPVQKYINNFPCDTASIQIVNCRPCGNKGASDCLCNNNSNDPYLTIDSMLGLLDLYSMRTSSEITPTAIQGGCDIGNMATSGGYQQYLIRKQLQGSDIDAVQPVKGFGSHTTTFHDLPDSVQLHIFSYLDGGDLCRACSVCSHWTAITTDNLLWERRLRLDSMKWDTISHTTNPDMFKECQSDLYNKEIYIRCNPEINNLVKQQNVTLHSFSSYIRSFLPKKIPRIAMFGPGMETETRGIVRKIIEDKTGLFNTTGMFPGRVRGLGSGFTIKVDNSFTLNYIPLYSNIKEERENRSREQRFQGSRFFQHQNADNLQSDDENTAKDQIDVFPITNDMKDMLRTLDGYIFTVDASRSEKEGIDMARSELFSMVNDQWCNPSAPVLVLACTPSTETPKVPNMQLVRDLRLGTFNRPWQIHTAVVDDMKGCIPALEWLTERCQRR